MPSAHVHSPLPGLRSRYDSPELARRLRAVDLVVVDIDECIFPGYSQSWLGYLIMLQIVTRPERIADLRHAPQLLAGGVYMRRVGLLQRLDRRPANRAMMARYVESMRGIPERYFRVGSEWIPRRTFAGVATCVAALGSRAPLGLISLGVHPVAEAYRRWLNGRAGTTVVAFTEANRVVFAPGADGRSRFVDYAPPLWVGAEEKLRALESRMAACNASTPLVIGNSADEVAMAALARRQGGLSVGFRPTRESAAAFDVHVSARDWRPLASLLGELL